MTTKFKLCKVADCNDIATETVVIELQDHGNIVFAEGARTHEVPVCGYHHSAISPDDAFSFGFTATRKEPQ